MKLFRQGELGRLILGALRQAERPLSTAEIASAILEAGGDGESARPTVAPRVRGNLCYLERRGKVSKSGTGEGALGAAIEEGTMGGIINIIIGLVLLVGGLSGQLVFRGTDSGPLLAVLGAGLILYGGYRFWRTTRKS